MKINKRKFLEKMFSAIAVCLTSVFLFKKNDVPVLRAFLEKNNPKRNIIIAWEEEELKLYLDIADEFSNISGKTFTQDSRIKYAASIAFQHYSFIFVKHDNRTALAYNEISENLRRNL
jgi:hypothetical protein